MVRAVECLEREVKKVRFSRRTVLLAGASALLHSVLAVTWRKAAALFSCSDLARRRFRPQLSRAFVANSGRLMFRDAGGR